VPAFSTFGAWLSGSLARYKRLRASPRSGRRHRLGADQLPDKVLNEAMWGATCGLDPDRVAAGIADTVEAFAEQAAALRAMGVKADVRCPENTDSVLP
jgi:hypothetical protein